MTHDTDTSDGAGDVEIEIEADGQSAPRDAQAQIKKLKAELERVEKERKEYLDGWQRAKADFINYKRDETKRLEELRQFLAGGVIAEMIAVLDSFDLALAHTPKEAERGILLIRGQLEDILKRHGLEEVPARVGDPFRPEAHESLGEAETDLPEGTIAEILQKGYMLGGRVVRPVRVKIAKGRLTSNQ